MTAPAGLLSEPICALRDLIAGAAAFQAWAGVTAGDSAAAAAFVHLLETPRNPTGLFVIVDFGTLQRNRTYSTNARQFEHAQGSTLTAYFRNDVVVGDAADDDAAMLDFANALGATWADIEKSAGIYAQRSLAVSQIDLTHPPFRIPKEKTNRAGDYIEAILTFTYTRQPR